MLFFIWFLLPPIFTSFIQHKCCSIRFPKSYILFDQKNVNPSPTNVTKSDIEHFLEKLKENKRIENEKKEGNWDCGEVEWEL